MDANKVISLWAGKNWPPPIRGYLFLPDAFNRIGRMLYGAEWQDDWATYDLLPLPPESPADASRLQRFEAHEYLDDLAGDANEIGYQDDYEEDVEPPPSELPQQFQYLGNPQFLVATAPRPTLSDPARRAPGFHISEEHWRLYRQKFQKMNEDIQRVIDKVGVAVQWLFDEAFAGSIVPFVVNASKGGDSSFTTRDDWLMPHVQHRRRRVQSCLLVPGQPVWAAGSHWIFIRDDELSKAIAAHHALNAPPASSEAPAASPPEASVPMAAAVRKEPRKTKTGNVDAALRAIFGDGYRDSPRHSDWKMILDGIADWSKSNPREKLPSDDVARRRAVYHLWPDVPVSH